LWTRIWLVTFINTTQTYTSAALIPYVTSVFDEHSLTATVTIVANLVGGLSKLPLAKILDIWGRPQGYALMTFLMTIGLVMMAGCNSVETYAAAQLIYWVG
jgi:MFS family permease